MKKPCKILLYLIIAGISVGILLRTADILNVFYFQNKELKIEKTGENEYRAKAGFENIDLSIKRDSLHYYQVILHRFSNLDRINYFKVYDASFTQENNTYTLTDAYNYDAKIWWVFWVKRGITFTLALNEQDMENSVLTYTLKPVEDEYGRTNRWIGVYMLVILGGLIYVFNPFNPLSKRSNKTCKILLYAIATLTIVNIMIQIVLVSTVFLYQDKELKVEKKIGDLYEAKMGFRDILFNIDKKEDSANQYVISMYKFPESEAGDGLNYFKDQYNYNTEFKQVRKNVYTLTNTYDYEIQIFSIFGIRKKIEFTLFLNEHDLEKSILVYNLK